GKGPGAGTTSPSARRREIGAAIADINVDAAREDFALLGLHFSKRACRAAGPDPTRPDDRPRLDPCAGSDAAAALDDYMLADDRHHADERVVADLTRAHPHIVSEGDALADDEVAADAIGEKQRVVLNIAARAQHDACIAGIEHAT